MILDDEHRRHIVKRLNDEQRLLYRAMSVIERDMCLLVLEGETWRDAYEKSSFAIHDTAGKATAEIRKLQESPTCQRFLKSIQDEEVDNRILKRDEGLRRLTRMSRGDISDVIEFKDEFIGMCPKGGGPMWNTKFGLKRASDIDPELMANIAEIAHTNNGIKVKHHSQKDAIQAIAKMQGWDNPGVLSIPGSGSGGGGTEDTTPLIRVQFIDGPGKDERTTTKN